VAHELRTPLSVIQGSMEALMDGVLPAQPATFQDVQRQAERLKRLVDDLQELSRVEAGTTELQIQPCTLGKILSQATRLMEPEFAAKGVALQVLPPGSTLRVLADPDRVEQVLINLLGNALRYTPAGGYVSISAEAKDRELRIAVQDSGQGIAAEHLPHLFERFYRADPSRTRASGGNGIGLTIARYIVEAHGGRIWAESAGLGRGSVFTFTLPLEGK
jgi:signal transduction histidine kinase